MKLSVIVPVYNRETTLGRCVESLLHQDLDDYEIILVDDGSTDGSKALMEAYEQAYPERVHLIHQENAGVACARNAGLHAALGEFITYVDSDDWLAENCFHDLWQVLQESSSDILVFDGSISYRDGTEKPWLAASDAGIEVSAGYLSGQQYLLSSPCPWNKWMRSRLFTDAGLRFPVGRLYEDLGTIPLLALQTEKIYYTQQAPYHYYQSTGSIMRQREYKKALDDIFPITENLRQQLGKSFPAETEYLWWWHLLLSAGRRYLECGREDLASRAADVMRAAYPNWKHNPYVARAGTSHRWLAALLYRKSFGIVKTMRRLKHIVRKPVE